MSFKDNGKSALFVRQTAHLDIDTPRKDSYELFESGLDFVLLTTDRCCYLKSHDNVTQYLPVDTQLDWLIQDGDVYPSDISLTLTEDQQVITTTGEQFPVSPLTPLINWLERYE